MNRAKRGIFSLVTGRTGRALRPVESYVPRIDDAYLDIALYLYQTPHSAQEGSEAGGSGFLVGLPADDADTQSWTIAVTNRHVVENGNPVIRLNTKDGATKIIDVPENAWIFHEDQDLAAVPIPLNESTRFRFIHISSLITREKALELDVGAGTDTFLVGRFIHRDGGQTNVPTVRFGHVAQLPTLIENSYGRPQESYLVETRSIGGYSGSPVFAYKQPFTRKVADKGDADTSYWGPALLGVDWGHSGQSSPVFDATDRETDMYVGANTGLSLVIPAWRLAELLKGEKMAERIKAISASL